MRNKFKLKSVMEAVFEENSQKNWWKKMVDYKVVVDNEIGSSLSSCRCSLLNYIQLEVKSNPGRPGLMMW